MRDASWADKEFSFKNINEVLKEESPGPQIKSPALMVMLP